jgi:serine protease inhibitor ecotin
MERGDRVQKRLEKLTHGSAHQFVDNLCQQLLRDNDKDRVLTFSTKLGEFQKSVYNYQHEVLQLEGWGENYRKLESISKNIRTVLAWVDELLVLAMVDITEVRQLYDKLELLYQKK